MTELVVKWTAFISGAMAATIELLVVEVCVDQLAAQPGGRVGLDPGRLPHEVRQVQAAADRGAGGGAETARAAAGAAADVLVCWLQHIGLYPRC